VTPRDEAITARDKLHAAARMLAHGIDGDIALEVAVAGAETLHCAAGEHLARVEQS